MSFLAEVGYAGERPENVETRANAGGVLPPGFYAAQMVGAKPVTAKSGSVGTEFVFVVTEGPFTGGQVTETLWDPNPERPNTAARMNDRKMLFASRLGLIRKSADGKKYEDVPGKSGWVDCLDAAVIVEVQHETYTRDDGGTGTSVKLTFGGLYDARDAAARAKIGKSPAAGQGGAKGGTAAANSTAKPAAPPADANPQAARRRAVANL